MFDAMLNQGTAKSRFGTGAMFSGVVHVALLGIAISFGSRPVEPKKKDLDITFVAPLPPPPPANAAPPPPPPPPPPKRSSRPKEEKVEVTDPDPVKKSNTIVEAKEVAPEAPVNIVETTSKDDNGSDNGIVGGAKNGQVGGEIGGKGSSTTPTPTPMPTPTPTPQNVVIPHREGMSKVSMVSGRDPVYTKDALAARVEGLMIVRCTITTTGAITNCRVIKELPHMKQQVLDALYSRRYTPVTFEGQLVNIDYTFHIKLVLPPR